jgi:hypothetical protein
MYLFETYILFPDCALHILLLNQTIYHSKLMYLFETNILFTDCTLHILLLNQTIYHSK